MEFSVRKSCVGWSVSFPHRPSAIKGTTLLILRTSWRPTSVVRAPQRFADGESFPNESTFRVPGLRLRVSALQKRVGRLSSSGMLRLADGVTKVSAGKPGQGQVRWVLGLMNRGAKEPVSPHRRTTTQCDPATQIHLILSSPTNPGSESRNCSFPESISSLWETEVKDVDDFLAEFPAIRGAQQ